MTKEKIEDCWIREGAIYELHPGMFSDNKQFSGITRRIPELRDLGIKTIVLRSHWPTPKWADIPVYYEVDNPDAIPTFYILDHYNENYEWGTPEELQELVDTIHTNDMKILFDLDMAPVPIGSWIYEHHRDWMRSTSKNEFENYLNKLKNEGMGPISYKWRIEAYDEYNDYVLSGYFYGEYQHDVLAGRQFKDSNVVYPQMALMIELLIFNGFNLDHTNPDVIDYYADIIEHYTEEYGIDGWRFGSNEWNWKKEFGGDYKPEEEVFFYTVLRDRLKQINPNAIILAEGSTLGNPYDLTEDPFFDEFTEISYSKYWSGWYLPCLYPLNIFYIAYNLESSESLVNKIINQNKKYNRPRAIFIANADSWRTQKVFSGSGVSWPEGCTANIPQVEYPLITLISTTPEVPFIYAGAEIGEKEGWEFESVIDWSGGNYQLRDHYKKVFKIRNTNNALKYGTIENVWISGDNTYAYLREYKDEKVIIVLNSNFLDKEATSMLDLSFLPEGTVLYDKLNDDKFTVDNPENFKISVPRYGSRILIPAPKRCDLLKVIDMREG